MCSSDLFCHWEMLYIWLCKNIVYSFVSPMTLVLRYNHNWFNGQQSPVKKTNVLCYICLPAPLQNAPESSVGRRRLLATAVPADEIVNPTLCLEINDLVLFKVWIDPIDRTLSHYPVYQKDHLYNSNPSFDYGAFTQLASYITSTNMTISSFAYVFTEGGNYVFRDSQIVDRWV